MQLTKLLMPRLHLLKKSQSLSHQTLKTKTVRCTFAWRNQDGSFAVSYYSQTPSLLEGLSSCTHQSQPISSRYPWLILRTQLSLWTSESWLEQVLMHHSLSRIKCRTVWTSSHFSHHLTQMPCKQSSINLTLMPNSPLETPSWTRSTTGSAKYLNSRPQKCNSASLRQIRRLELASSMYEHKTLL